MTNEATTSPESRDGVTRSGSRWNDDVFLDRLRASLDVRADEALRELREGQVTAAETGRIFAAMSAEPGTAGGQKPEDLPPPMARFFADTDAIHHRMLAGVDVERMERGKELFRQRTAQACLVMLAASLPAGYSAPCLTRVLTVSDDLSHHPYRRLLGVLQLVVNITRRESHQVDGYGFVTAQKLRLLHAGIRAIVPGVRPQYVERYGAPVNHEDMLATIMGFSHLVIAGCRKFGVDVSDQQAEDYWYLWRQFSRMMGIAPTGDPLSEEFVPETYADAVTFYEAYARRHYAVDPGDNPEGVLLARENLRMMRDLMPLWVRLVGGGRMPLIAMQELLGDEGMRRIGIQPLTGHHADRQIFDFLLRIMGKGQGDFPTFTEKLAELLIGDMIRDEMGGEVTFLVPMSLGDMEQLTKRDGVAVRREH